MGQWGNGVTAMEHDSIERVTASPPAVKGDDWIGNLTRKNNLVFQTIRNGCRGPSLQLDDDDDDDDDDDGEDDDDDDDDDDDGEDDDDDGDDVDDDDDDDGEDDDDDDEDDDDDDDGGDDDDEDGMRMRLRVRVLI